MGSRGRTTSGKPSVEEALDAARQAIRALVTMSDGPLTNASGAVVSHDGFFEAARELTQPYRVAAGFVSRKVLPVAYRAEIRAKLFRARSRLDERIEDTIIHHFEHGALSLDRLLRHELFGYTKKQGVSLRLSLNTCAPTPLCGGSCYAHDGRERVTATIVSGCFTTAICRLWEAGSIPSEGLLPHVRRAVALARDDAAFSKREYGFGRRPRVRLAHVGEIAAFPKFANWLAGAISSESNGEVDCIAYTRHPGVEGLDVSRIVVNLTVDESSENRRKWAREGVRVVWSAWDGTLDPSAEVNFLEHHEFTHSSPQGKGRVCPATSADTERRFCDAFGCVRCFESPLVQSKGEGLNAESSSKDVRTRTVGIMRRGAQAAGDDSA